MVGQFEDSRPLNHMSAQPAPMSARNTGSRRNRNPMSLVSRRMGPDEATTANMMATPRYCRRTRISQPPLRRAGPLYLKRPTTGFSAVDRRHRQRIAMCEHVRAAPETEYERVAVCASATLNNRIQSHCAYRFPKAGYQRVPATGSDLYFLESAAYIAAYEPSLRTDSDSSANRVRKFTRRCVDRRNCHHAAQGSRRTTIFPRIFARRNCHVSRKSRSDP